MTGIIDNKNVKLEDVIENGLKDENVEKLRVGVGYFFTGGLKAILPELQEFIYRGGKIDVLMGNTVNRKTYEELARTYKDLDLVRGEQPNNFIREEDRRELKEESKRDFHKQVLFQEPSVRNEEYLNLLRKWLEDGSLQLKVYPKERFHAKTYIFETGDSEGSGVTRPSISGVVGSSNLTLSGLRSNTELNAAVYTHDAEALQEWYEGRWGEADDFSPDLLDVINNSWVSYQPGKFPSPYYVYLKAIYEMYRESLETVEEILRTFEVYKNLYDFQKWAVLRAVRVATNYGGVMVSDVVGMGKTYVGAALLEHFYHRNYSLGRRGKLLVICPPKLENMWRKVINKYTLQADVESLGMLSKENYHVDLLDKHSNVSVVLIDESHHFRNTGTNRYENITRFLPLANETILLTATPYTKGAEDVYNQIKLFHREDVTKLPITPPNLKEFTKRVEGGESSLSELLAHVMVRRTRHEILEQYGEVDDDGRQYLEMDGERMYLPERHLSTEEYSIEEVYGKGLYKEIVDKLFDLTYARYSLGSEDYLKPVYFDDRKYQDLSTMGKNLRGLMKQLLLKRLESSIPAFCSTLGKILRSYKNFSKLLEEGEIAIGEEIDELLKEEEDLERIRDQIEAKRMVSELKEYDIGAFYIDKLKHDLDYDVDILQKLHNRVIKIKEDIEEDFTHDDKLRELATLINDLYEGDHELVEGRTEKILVFSQYVDTVEHLEKGLEEMQNVGLLSKRIRMDIATADTKNVDEITERFAPKANEAVEKYTPDKEIDLLISTDLMGEGMNLQDANVVINYDIHWNPLRLIQRIGRIDRLGTEHEHVHVFNFLPETSLDEELGLVGKVGVRIKEINKVLGMDNKVLQENEKPNPSFMRAIYGKNIEAVEEYEREVLLDKDAVSGSVNELRRLKEKEPELLDKVVEMDGVRSAKVWNGKNDAVIVLCSAGEYATPYLIQFEDDEGDIDSIAPEQIIEKIKCERGEKPVQVSEDMFRERYSNACNLAQSEFKNEIMERERLAKPKSSKYRNYVDEELKKLAEEVEDIEQKKTIHCFREIVRDTNIPQVLGEFRDLEKNVVTGAKILTATKEIVAKYKLEEKFEQKEEWRKTLTEPPHVLCGMYLKSK